jgi:hypothetical protein
LLPHFSTLDDLRENLRGEPVGDRQQRTACVFSTERYLKVYVIHPGVHPTPTGVTDRGGHLDQQDDLSYPLGWCVPDSASAGRHVPEEPGLFIRSRGSDRHGISDVEQYSVAPVTN